ncbi:hypothetical protein [Donghicola tyrosinivorans]|uniref:Uncharacterized protein n=1 Tax=Donghicola tyrosinivorans TaxID=1652492 RepID=A0A2T0X535_9RHOB|nr:hypothetical protein [Donghicola tyrosinivorans]PRY94049.1 hypothetical protein CLV74_101179 [Donghicola tyrosinivorans]
MSAPDTNLEKQKRQHAPALWGIRAAAGFGVAMLLIAAMVAVAVSDPGGEVTPPVDAPVSAG